MSKKKSIPTLLAFLLIVQLNNFAHSQIKEGHFQYVIMTSATDTSLEVRQKVGMIQDSKMDLFFMDQKSRLDFNMGKAFYTCIVVDNSIPRGLSLKKGPEGSYAVYIGKDALQKQTENKDTTAHVELLSDKRTILGFVCNKAILYKNGEVTIYWYTNEIQVDKSGNPLLNDMIPGFPMSFITTKDGMKIEYIVSNYETKLEHKEVIFSLMVPEGYKLISNGN